jgi:hypothetical protein
MNESGKSTDTSVTSASTSLLLDESVSASTSRKLKNNRKSFKQEKLSTSSVESERIQTKSRKRSIVNDDVNDEEEDDDEDDENLTANSVKTQGVRFKPNDESQPNIQISNSNSNANKPLHKQSKRVLYENMGLTQELANCLGVSDLLRSEDDEDNLLSEVDDDDDVDFMNITNTLNETNTHLKLNDDLHALVNEEDDDEVDEEEQETDDVEIINTVSSLSSSSGSVIEIRNQPPISNNSSINKNNKSNSNSICTTSSSINNNFSSLYTGDLSNLDSTLAENNDEYSQTRLLLLEDESSSDDKHNNNDKSSLNDQQDNEQDDIVDDIEHLINDQSARSQIIQSNEATIDDESPTSSNSSNNNFSLHYNEPNTKSKLNSHQNDFKSTNTQNTNKPNRSSLLTASEHQLRSQTNSVRPKTPDFNRNNCSTTATTSTSTSSNSLFSASSDFINQIRSSSPSSSLSNNLSAAHNSNTRNIISNLNSLNFLMTNYTPPNINLTYVPQNRSANGQNTEQQTCNSSNTNSNIYNQPENRVFYQRNSASSNFIISLFRLRLSFSNCILLKVLGNRRRLLDNQMHVSSSTPSLPSLAETAATNVSRFMSSIGPVSSVPRDLNNQSATNNSTTTRRVDDPNYVNRFPRVHNSFTRLWLDQQNRLEMERRRMGPHSANLNSSSTSSLSQNSAPPPSTSSPAIQTSVSISTGTNQTNLAHIATNTNVNEFGIQHISIPGMQISIGSVPTNANVNNTNNTNLHPHSPQIASVNVNLSSNPQSISFLSNGSNSQNIITFPNVGMMSSHSNGLMPRIEPVPSLSSISALAGALQIHTYQPTSNAQSQQASSAPPPPPPSVRLHRSHGPVSTNQNPYVFNYNPNSQNGQSTRQQSHPYASLNQQVNNTYHNPHQHSHHHIPHLHHHHLHHNHHLNRREDLNQTTPFIATSSTLLPQAYMDVSSLFSLTRENMIAHMNPRVRIPRILLDRSIEVTKNKNLIMSSTETRHRFFKFILGLCTFRRKFAQFKSWC